MPKSPTKKKTVKEFFKAKIIVILKSGELVYGDGVVHGLRTNDGKEAHIVAEFNKPFPKKS